MRNEIEVTLLITTDESCRTFTAEARDADNRLITASRVVSDPSTAMTGYAITACANVASSLAQRACLPDTDEEERIALLRAARDAMRWPPRTILTNPRDMTARGQERHT